MISNRIFPDAYLIYKATNVVNGKFYIGVTKKLLYERARDHLSESKRDNYSCKKFHAALRKYGKDCFHWEVIDTADCFSDAMLKEVAWIANLKPVYNICRGGRGAPGAMTGKKHSKETINRLRALGYERKDLFAQYSHLGPASMRKRVVCLNTGEIFSCANEASKRFGIDRACIIETCLKTYKRKTAGKGLVFRYFGDHLGGKKEAERIIQSTKSRWRAVICLSDSKEFESIAQAGRFYSIDKELVSQSCKKGYLVSKDRLKFRYKDSAEVIRICDTAIGKQLKRQQAAQACLAAADAAKKKREARLVNG